MMDREVRVNSDDHLMCQVVWRMKGYTSFHGHYNGCLLSKPLQTVTFFILELSSYFAKDIIFVNIAEPLYELLNS